MITKPILSIIIPVYNGEETLPLTIESVASQIINNMDIEFIIRDNCSTDNTQKIVEEFQQKYPGIITYDRRNVNVIADVNFAECVKLAKGSFILLLGDDDILLPNFVTMFLHVVKKYPDIGLFYVNRLTTSRSFEGLTIKHKDPQKDPLRYYKSSKEWIMEHISGPDFISVNVVRTDCFIKGFETAKVEHHYGYPTYYAMLKGIVGKPVVYSFVPYVLQTIPNIREWSDRALLYVMVGLPNVFRDLEADYPEISKAWAKHCETLNTYSLLSSIPMNRNLYKNKWNEIKPTLSFANRIWFQLLLRSDIAEVIYRKTMIFNKIHRIIQKKNT